MRRKRGRRQDRWAKRCFREGNCVKCCQSRKGSPYKRVCIDCAVRRRWKEQVRYDLEAWTKGKAGRPPLTARPKVQQF